MQTLIKHNPVVGAFVAAVAAVAVIASSLVMFEPVLSHAQITDEFTVTQTVGAEISFLTPANDVTMVGSVQGVSGGTAYGTSTFNVRTNNAAGYNVTIEFATTTAMQGDGGITTDIGNFTSSAGTDAQYDWSVATGDAEFGYTVIGTTEPTTIAQSFKDDGASTCGGSNTNTNNYKCWYMASDATNQVTIVNSSAATPGTGATTTLVFQVQADAPSPNLESGTYTATATLTATTN